ncbi:MAG: hypothetical protein LBI91_02090 [Spirochaetaceae bacterium]|nr:hypothetical protein [Spirochaetaceae bacterium]
MKKNIFFTGMPVMALVFALVFTGCPTDSGGGESDPISVNLSLPPIQDVEAFTGTFVSDETEAKDLVGTAFTEIAGISDISSLQNSVYSVSRSISRSVYSEPYEEIFDHDTTLLQGAEVTGFVQGETTASAADDNNPGSTVGDYQEVSLKAKLAIVFKDVTRNGSTIKGKYGIDESMYYKLRLTSINPQKGEIAISSSATDGYAVSISKGGKGLKFVMEMQGKVNNKTIPVDGSFDPDDIGDLFDTYNLSLKIYDNDNEEQYSQTFTSYAAAAAYLGISQ